MIAADAPIVWFAGVDWDGVQGSDHRIVEQIAKRHPVMWINPARKDGWKGWLRGVGPAVVRCGPITVFRVPATIGVTRMPFRMLTNLFRRATFRRAVSTVEPRAVVVANPIVRFPRTTVRKVLYLTDHWVAGAELMGLDPQWIRRVLAHNAADADLVAAVSEPLVALADQLAHAVTRSVIVANGSPQVSPRLDAPLHRVAGLIGQINERIDLELLEAAVAEGVPLRIVGPQRARDTDFLARFDRLTSHALVDWRGPVAADEVPQHLAEIAVGITPYTRSEFNLASSPLKTLEYLAAGVEVISSDLPSSRWLGGPDIAITTNPAEFAAACVRAVSRPRDDGARERRIRFAVEHSWSHRGEVLLAALDEIDQPSRMALTGGDGHDAS
ncbi:glycosyltransferase (plasmid) [Coraliomargarita sp. W4R53]